MRQWPPEKRLKSSCSTTSFWPTTALDNSASMRFRASRICSTVRRSISKGVVVSVVKSTPSMRHRVEHDVDPHRVALGLRERLEVPLVLALALPAVAQVRVVTDNAHHPPLLVEDRTVVR